VPWLQEFFEPIPLPSGRKLATLRDAALYITKLPKAEHDAKEWQAAMQALMLVAEHDGPTMFARIGVMRGLHRHMSRKWHQHRAASAARLTRSFDDPDSMAIAQPLGGESWHDPSCGALCSRAALPNFTPSGGRRGVFCMARTAHKCALCSCIWPSEREAFRAILMLADGLRLPRSFGSLVDVRCCSHNGLKSDIAPCPLW
jgi:hypothetical protein